MIHFKSNYNILLLTKQNLNTKEKKLTQVKVPSVKVPFSLTCLIISLIKEPPFKYKKFFMFLVVAILGPV